MRSPLLTAALAVAALAPIGCNQFRAAPLVPASQFPNAIAAIEKLTDQIIRAFDAGQPKQADSALHQLGSLFGTVERLAPKIGLSKDEQAAVKKASNELIEAFSELHAPMHKAEFPSDFDFDPVRVKIEKGLMNLRAALPVGIAKIVQEKADSRGRATGPAPFAPTEDAAPAGPPPEAGAATAAPAADHLVADSPAPLCPSVMLWDEASRRLAAERINQASELLASAPPDRRWVQLVPTLHARLSEDLHVDAYGLMLDRRDSWTSAENFEAATDGLADRLRDSFAAAIRRAVRRGLNISILPHVDSAGGAPTRWRNWRPLDPTETIGVGSYESLLLRPLAEAIVAEATSDTRIDFAVCGEMGRSLFENPLAYAGILKRLRERFASSPKSLRVRLGVAVASNADVAGDLTDKQVSTEGARAMLDQCDFLGLSVYPSVSLPPRPYNFAETILISRLELQRLLDRGEVPPLPPLVISEVGLGARRGATVTETAQRPWDAEGVIAENPWHDPSLRELRRRYHAALCDYLAKGDVQRAYLWSEGPWDPQGLDDERFRDEEIVALIAAHNRR